MFGRKNRRIADLEAREEYRINRVAQLEDHLRTASAAAARSHPERLGRRLDSAVRAIVRARTEAAAQTRRAALLQDQIDELLGLNNPAIAAGANWQDRRPDTKTPATA